MRTAFLLAGALAIAFGQSAIAADTIKIGFIETFSGPTAPIGIDALAPIVTPGVVADVPRALGVEELEPDHLVSAQELERVLERQGSRIVEGGALFIRTGWGREWPNVPAGAHHSSPGPRS